MWNIEQLTGYKPMTTFWEDFTIAEKFGEDALFDTFKRAFGEWRNDYRYLTELVMVLNHKSWQWYERDDRYCEIYVALFETTDNYAVENLKGEKLQYYLRITD